jgi:hypothetical protein
MLSLIFWQVLNLVYELPEDDTNVSKYVGVVQDHNFESLFDLFIKLVLKTNIKKNWLIALKLILSCY